MLLASTAYALSSVAEEFLVSKRPLYEVVGQLGIYGVLIIGVQASIFDRNSFRDSTWSPPAAGYIAGFAVCQFIFYSLVPVVYRMASAAYFNISILTANFWAVLIGTRLFGYTIFYMYGVSFVCVMSGLIIYYVWSDVLGESTKPWLGGEFAAFGHPSYVYGLLLIMPTEDQEQGVLGVGTAKKQLTKGIVPERNIEALIVLELPRHGIPGWDGPDTDTA